MKQKVELQFEMPDWAKYHAIDENGDFCVFETQPFLIDEIVGEGIFETRDNFMLLAKNCSTSNWKESLTTIA
jgi:hypothetical protein